jgi:hypothetical protein
MSDKQLMYYHSSPFKLYVAQSQIPSAGLGVFTSDFIPSGERIDEYKGDLCNRSYGGAYALLLDKHTLIDAADLPRCYMAMINDCSFIPKQYVRKKKRKIDVTPVAYYSATGIPLDINCEFQINTDTKQAFVYAICDIQPGTELFISYGPDYWRYR